ncbi:probable phosphorylase b kinase regulatory subunit beta isoform X2 [Folsomia candida]|nr:probable phosphorylase b kinase regulatory subunit beta isoform X2 [Folsomia candida]
MRGILECWIRQADRVEQFKQNQSHQFALHCKFHLETGDTVFGDDEYFHLQIDVVSLYIIYLVQMITSGLQIIFVQDEVNFVQNLVYYVERAYRTPDYGMWERGSKYNDGTAEIHASSIGMAKAALEAINGCNLFGDVGTSWSVIFVDIDAHNRNRSIFETLLPRESSSKNIDISLLSTISYPAFATHDEQSYSKTKQKILRKLKGDYGFKRYLRDGYKTMVEDTERRFYTKGETKNFENIECQWPIFYLYMIIDGVFKGIPDQVEEYCQLAKLRLIRDNLGDPIVPRYFYVPKESIEEEKQEPGSQARLMSGKGSDSEVFLWGQAMYIIAQLLTSGLVHLNEIDLARRYLPTYNRPRRALRYSAFQGTASDLVVQVVLIAESHRLQAMLATYGIQAQTPVEVEPVQIWPPSQLVKVHEYLGVNKKLGLKGRPPRPVGALGTSKVYRVCGQTVLSYPLMFEVSDFYLSHDMTLLIDDIKTELHFVGKNWRLSGRPTMVLLIREDHMRDRKFKELLDLFAELKKGHCDGLKVRIGRLQNLISSSCIEHLDFMNHINVDLNVAPFRQVVHEYSGYQSLTDVPKAIVFNDPFLQVKEYKEQPTSEILEAFRNLEGFYAKCQLLGFLLKREGADFLVEEDLTVQEALHRMNDQAGVLRLWGAVRYASSLLCQLVDSISPYITTILVNGKQLTFGVVGKEEVVIDKPMSPAEIRDVIYSKVQPYDIVQATLQQELALYCGKLIVTHPDVFDGILKIRIGWVLQAIQLYMDITKENVNENFQLSWCSPSEVRRLLQIVLDIGEHPDKLSVFQRRQIEGCLCRVPTNFYGKVWHVLRKTPGGIIIAGKTLPQEPTLSHMTLSELNFALQVEIMLHNIEHPEYIQIVIELLCVVSTILQRNPELAFNGSLDVDQLVESAYQMFQKDFKAEGAKHGDNELYPFFNAPAATTTGYLARAVVNNILQGDMRFGVELNEFSRAELCVIQ